MFIVMPVCLASSSDKSVGYCLWIIFVGSGFWIAPANINIYCIAVTIMGDFTDEPEKNLY